MNCMINNENNNSVALLTDPKFYLENFCRIKGKEGKGLIPFILKPAQLDIFNTMRQHNRVIIMKARQIGFCVDKNTKVLSNNLEWISADEIRVGQEIVSVDEFPIKKGRGGMRKMRNGVVEAKRIVYEEAFKLKMDNGEELIATGPHRFLCLKNGIETEWKTIDKMISGNSIRYITKTNFAPNFEDGWFAGMIDGEGSLAKKSRTGALLTISQVDGPVWDNLVKYANDNDYNFRVEIDKRTPSDSRKYGEKPVNKLIIGRMDELIRLFSITKPVRFSNRQWWVNKQIPNNGWSKIISIESIGKREMIDLQTSEKTFIANGFISHNSTCVTGFLYHKTIMTEGVTTAIVGYNNDLTAELLDKIKTFYRTTPDSLKPTIHYNSKYEISFPKVDSKILVLPSTENVGRGYTLNYCLCVSGETEVLTPNGYSKKISEIKKKDLVINGNGLKTTVKKIWKKENHEKLRRIYLSTDFSFKATEDHDVLSFSEKGPIWKKIKDLTTDDYLAYPITPISSDVKTIKIEDVTRHDRGGNTKKIKMEIDINRAFGLFCGWYLAEGSCENNNIWGPNRISISINKKEVSHVIDIIKSSILPYISSYTLTYSNDSDRAVIRIHGRNFTNFLIQKFGRISIEKKIPDEIWSWGKDFCEGLIFGLFCGDGCFKNIDNVVLTSTTQSIIYQVKKLLVSLEIGMPSVWKKKSFRYGKQCRDRFDLVLSGVFNRNFRQKFNLPIKDVTRSYKTIFKKDDKYYYHKIKKINITEVESFVYDMMVESEDHSFCLPTNIIKNCTEIPFWDNTEEKMVTLEASVPVNGKIIIESSPGAVGDYFHRMWVSDNDYIKKEYGWWWDYSEKEIETIRKRMANPRKFNNNYALEFLMSGRSVFSRETIALQRKNVFKIGASVKMPDGTEHIVRQDSDGFVIYKPVEPNHFYAAGADCSEGVTGGDYSVCAILDRSTGEQVGFWRGYIAPDRFANILDKWGRYYNNALMVVESEAHGNVVLHVLKNLLYPSLYFRPTKFDTMARGWSDKLGWKTNKVTRPLLIDEFEQMVRENQIKIRSKEIVDEMTVFIFNDANNMVAMQSYNDDGIFAAAIACQGFKVISDKPLTQINYVKHLPNIGY